MGDLCSGLCPGVLRRPTLWVVLVTIVAAGGCERSSSKTDEVTAGPSADPAAAAEAMIQKECVRCHARSTIEGKTAADIRGAIRKIPSMGKYDGQLTDEELQALAKVLAKPGD